MSKTSLPSQEPYSAVSGVNGTERRAWGTFVSTFLQTMAPVFFLIVFLLVLLLYFFLPLLEESYLHQKRLMCKYLVQVQITYLEALHTDVLKGTISMEEAQGRALRRLRMHRFGEAEKDYFWALGPERTLVMHPYRPDLEGINPDEAKGPDGELLRGLFDGIEAAEYVGLTTVETPMAEMGEEAVRVFLRRLKTPDAPAEHILLPTRLVVRSTTA